MVSGDDDQPICFRPHLDTNTKAISNEHFQAPGHGAGASGGGLQSGVILHRMWADATEFRFGKEPAHWPREQRQIEEQHEQSLRPKGRCPDRSLGTMGEAISLRIPNRPKHGKVVKQIETPRPPAPIMRRLKRC
ncbi:hypothetical protein DBIPINDM_003652 [Mesorhizobium sp. AR02]|uniref:hypothetical protein n=1 Tax=Mesorhizobium sp. AR02 TaxID=2865837 RepID=UPI00215FBD04|nr:hypothetical protein [Mesorhizobium sp. AR02]UVK50481.1 hypothetical protein DBIPINDM_003652 [Mesorhizobium sp. AR02]